MQIRSKSTRETGSTFPLTYCRPDINSCTGELVPEDFIYEELQLPPTASPRSPQPLPGFSRDLFADIPISTRLVFNGCLDRVPPPFLTLPFSHTDAIYISPRLYLSQVITSEDVPPPLYRRVFHPFLKR